MKQFPIPSSPAPSGGERKPEPKATEDSDSDSYAKGGFVKPTVIDRAGASTGVGRLEGAEHQKRKHK